MIERLKEFVIREIYFMNLNGTSIKFLISFESGLVHSRSSRLRA